MDGRERELDPRSTEDTSVEQELGDREDCESEGLNRLGGDDSCENKILCVLRFTLR